MSTNLHDKRCRKPIGSRNNNTNTTRRSIQDLCSRFSYLSTSFLRAHHIISHSHGSGTDSLGLGPASELFRLSTPAKQPVYIFLYRFIANIHFLQFCFLFFFSLLYTNYSKKTLRFGFPGESLWLNLVVFVFLLLLRLLFLLYLVVVVVTVVVVGLRRCPNSQL